MLCYLYSKELRKRVGKPDFFVCKWVGVIGDVNADKAETIKENGKTRKVLSIKAVKARQINLTKCIFPASDNEVKEWDKVLQPLKQINFDTTTGAIEEVDVNSNPDECVWLNLCYKQIQLSEISDSVKKIEYTKSNGEIAKQDYITVIGFADDNGDWAEDLTAVETARNNLVNGLSNGTYIDVTEESEEE